MQRSPLLKAKPTSSCGALGDGKMQRRRLEVTEEQVCEWLKNRNWLLLIDELNKFDLQSNQKRLRAENGRFAEFLKRHFLVKKGRYFVFSTHEMSICNFMENDSDRGAKVKPLPLMLRKIHFIVDKEQHGNSGN